MSSDPVRRKGEKGDWASDLGYLQTTSVISLHFSLTVAFRVGLRLSGWPARTLRWR